MSQSPLRLIPADQLGDLPPTERLGTTKLVARGLNVIFGPSGCYKSFYTLDASLRIAQRQPIIYVVGEGLGGIHRRVSAWCEHNKIGPGQAYFIDREVNLLDQPEVKILCQSALNLKPSLIVFDTLARCIPGGDENSAKDMGLLGFLDLATFRTHGAKVLQVINALNIPERTIYRLLSHCRHCHTPLGVADGRRDGRAVSRRGVLQLCPLAQSG